jgi:radical SAM protein with 4Fe4S-binding SPASM domain
LEFTLNELCNIRCHFCPLSLPPEKRPYKSHPNEKLPLPVYKKIIEDGVKNGLCSINLSCGFEPLLEKRIVDYIKIAEAAGVIDIMMHTNAQLLTPEKSMELMRGGGLTWINFSIGAVTQKTYESMCDGADFDLILRNILEFIAIKKQFHLKLPIVRVSFVHTQQNTHELDDFVQFWQNKADVVVIQNLVNSLKNTDKEINFKDDLYIKIDKEENKTKKYCSRPFHDLRIGNNGDITPCSNFLGFNLVFGNVYKDNVKDVFNSDPMNRLRASINTDERPKGCTDCLEAMTW